MQLTSENIKDIRKYFCESFVKFKETGDFLWYLKNVDEERLYGVGENGDELDCYLDNKNPYDLDYVLPHKSYFQWEEKAVLLYRIPAQQYSRGLNKCNTAMSTPTPGSNGTLPKTVPVNFDTLKCYVNKQRFIPLEEAASLPYQSCVLQKRMAFVRATNEIVLDFTPIAKVVGKQVKVKQPLFINELKKLVEGTPFKIV